jgi:hypothetical protein
MRLSQTCTLLSVVVGFLGLAIAVLIHRQQVSTQIFLEISSRYDELLTTSPVGM